MEFTLRSELNQFISAAQTQVHLGLQGSLHHCLPLFSACLMYPHSIELFQCMYSRYPVSLYECVTEKVLCVCLYVWVGCVGVWGEGVCVCMRSVVCMFVCDIVCVGDYSWGRTLLLAPLEDATCSFSVLYETPTVTSWFNTSLPSSHSTHTHSHTHHTHLTHTPHPVPPHTHRPHLQHTHTVPSPDKQHTHSPPHTHTTTHHKHTTSPANSSYLYLYVCIHLQLLTQSSPHGGHTMEPVIRSK